MEKGDEFVMNNRTDKKIINEIEENIEENKNSFNDIKIFLKLLLVSQLFMLYLSGRQMFFENIDCSPAVAGINTILLIITIHHIRKFKIGKK
ncbi:MAG: hypothetical protein WCZ27_07775 [Tissierellaceae bacterium]